MSENCFPLLRKYFLAVAAVLRGEADAASVFPLSSDIGQARELVYARFLRQHAPSKCNVSLGGYLFDEDGATSRQIDVLVTTDTAPRFDLLKRNGIGKAFSPVEGCLGIASIKSKLDRDQLEDSLLGISSVPPTRSLEGRASFTIQIADYDDWPYKIVYATHGVDAHTASKHLEAFYAEHADIPDSRRPNLIHVAGQYALIRVVRGMRLASLATGQVDGTKPALGTYKLITSEPDLQAMLWALHALQQNAAVSTEILFDYSHLISKVCLSRD